MNQLIEKFIAESTICQGHPQIDGSYFDKEKFAELIVRECLKCGDNLSKYYIENHPEKEQVLLLASIADYSNQIKQHFGVE
jgi:predicted  nucleic acid-binding Zn-ribbon protein